MRGNNLPAPADVIKLCKKTGFERIRLFDPNHDILQALRGSGLQVSLGVTNADIPGLAGSQEKANAWVATNVKAYPDVSFTYISVGNEMIPSATSHDVARAIQNIHNAVVAAGRSTIKVTAAVASTVLGVSYPPSQGAFSAAAVSDMTSIVSVLAKIGSPLMANVYPYYAYAAQPGKFSKEYALFTAQSPPVRDGNLDYWCLFDAIVDSFYSAMERVGGANVGIVVSESGWPSAGNGASTTPDLAKLYNNNLIKHVASKGTPKRPNSRLDTFVFAMFNENLKPAGIEQSWGLFYPNMQPVYSIVQ
ncbi:hypothetical protein AAC387_Pa11g1966 [Persea americana]